MRLRNKKTGEIKAFDEVMREAYKWNNYNSLTELNEEWEDYEEPKGYWMIDTSVLEPVREIAGQPYEIDRAIGNYFRTKEEAEKAVEKLKAWKRLKDTGFKFTGWDRHPDFPGDFRITASDEWSGDDKDLDLLFCPEENI